MRNQEFYDKLFKGLGDAIVDIREKVVEEPWFGRVVNEREVGVPQWPQARETQPEADEQSRDEAPDRDIDMDR